MRTIICFHNPNEDNGYLSNWYPSKFTCAGRQFSSMEQYMMYRKSICFNDETIAAEILKTDDVAAIKALGRQVTNYNDHIWNGMRQIIIYEGLLAKFSQNEALKQQLLATGDATLAECAVKDKIWAIGLSLNDPDRFDIAKWKGQNLLGYALMIVRKKLEGKTNDV
ncbi:MAG: NADAR family protein [Blautia sp.]|nr:NADAR family protein [Blautia sp.]